MNRSIRGAATVGVVWVIVLLALLLFAGGGIYVLASEKTKNEDAVRAAQTAAATAEARYTEAAGRLRALAVPVGFRDESDPGSMSRPEEILGRLSQLRENHGDFIGADVTSVSRAIERMESRVADLARQLTEAKQGQDAAETARASMQQNLSDVTRQKDEVIAQRQKDLQDERDRNAQQEQADRQRIDDLNGRISSHEARARAEKEELESQIAVLRDEMRKRDGRIAELSKRVEVIRLPDEPDGAVVQVSNAGTCYIDLGNRDLLRRGTRFKVFTYGKNGEMREKGMIEVSSVQDDMSECTVVDLKDRFDPLARGDKIAAPNYDPEMPREFVLSGRFPSGYSRAMVADRLRSLGAKVAEKVGPTTDFLILGDEEKAPEGEEGAEEEGGAEGGTTAEMQLAQLYRVQILPVREILEYLKYE